MPGEFDFIDFVRSRQRTSGRVPLAAGDDLAALRFDAVDGLILVGVDQVLDGVHFESAVHAPERIGRKAMNRNLSDCAAMACLPTAAVVGLALPRGLSIEWAKRLYDGLREAGAAFDCPIVGGDTGSWDGKLAVTVAILGRAAGVGPVRRSGAKPGDAVYVTGPLGGSLLGRHLDFVPRVAEARDRVARHRVTAMIDVSDGLSRDAGHLARESGVGIVLEADAVPVHPDVARLDDGRSPLDHALHDGEDYELCFTGEADIATATRVGTVVDGEGVWIERSGQRQRLTPGGFEHALSSEGKSPLPVRPGEGTGGVFASASVADTERLAAALAGTLRGGDVVALHGDLGAGKTQFARGLVAALGGDPLAVSSPTYVLLHVYPTASLTVYHLDAYRVHGGDDFDAIGFDELLEQNGVVVVEWPARVADRLPAVRLDVTIEAAGETTRTVRVDDRREPAGREGRGPG